MKKSFFLLLLLILTASVMACGAPASVIEETKAEGTEQETEEKQVIYKNITADEAKEIMDSESGYVILDVRTEEEYAEGHIPGAILIPDYEIIQKAESILPTRIKGSSSIAEADGEVKTPPKPCWRSVIPIFGNLAESSIGITI